MPDHISIERWLPVVDWEDLYEVSNHGRVRSLDRITHDSLNRTRHWPGKLLVLSKSGNGYYTIHLCVGGRNITVYVHTLVLEAFVGPRPAGMESLHGPNGRLDNHWPENLSYGTSAQNSLDTIRDGNDYHLNLTHCPRGHLLQEPNLIPSVLKKGYRECLTCSRAKSNQRIAERYGRPYDLQVEMIKHYDRIMSGNAYLKRTHCPRGHLLEAPNLVPHRLATGRRTCLACARAESSARTASHRGHVLDVQAKADENYYKIIIGRM